MTVWPVTRDPYFGGLSDCRLERETELVTSYTTTAKRCEVFTGHGTRATSHVLSVGKRAVIGFKLGEGNHINRVPRTSFEERSVRAFAGAQFAADA